VIELPSDPQMLSVTPSNFSEHLKHLKENYHVISLSELGKAIAKGDVPNRTVVITFDDGYADNLWYAKPLLEKAEVPATVFITTGKINDSHEFWWDELERVILLSQKLPEKLKLTIDGTKYNWVIKSATDRMTVYKELHALLRPLEYNVRERVMSELFHQVGTERRARPEYRPLKAEEILELSKNGLIEIGAHTANHSVLSVLSKEKQWEEIIKSKKELEAVLKKTVTSFSYPFGTHSDIDENTKTLVKKAGFTLACANVFGKVHNNTDPFWIPRFLVRNWDSNIFSKKLRSLWLW
jgi:peptidoglycan/xylan/chitin deacetylase (PgdA/CDA1 family)